MSDLISRSAVIELLRKNTSNDIQDRIITENNINLIMSVPIAYDKEAVVEQLENEEKFWESSYDYQIGKQKARSYRHAIELVKAGGIDG